MRPADGRLGVLTVGLGAVASTLIAGVELVKRGLAEPIGSLALMDTIRLGKRTDDRNPLIKDFAPIATLDDVVFGAWDPFPDDAYVAAQRAGVLDAGKHVEAISDALRDVRPMAAAFDRTYVKNIDADNTKGKIGKRAMLEAIREDINRFREDKQVERVVMIWARVDGDLHRARPGPRRRRGVRGGDRRRRPDDRPVDALRLRRAAGGRAVLQRRAEPHGRHPRAPRLRHRPRAWPSRARTSRPARRSSRPCSRRCSRRACSACHGWYSTNILGNRDGEVLDDPDSFKTKEESKLGVLEHILQPETFPALYGDIFHKVRINYYPPRGDNKEGWDNIDIFGWLGYPMQIKVDFLCRDSILAAPLALDLVLFTDLAQRAGLGGIQEWLSFYYKSPMAAPGLLAEDDLFIQLTKLKNTLRWMMGEDQITHLGREYYATSDDV